VARRLLNNRKFVGLLVVLAMAGIWQLLSVTYTTEAVKGEPMIPGWQVLFTQTFITLSDYWRGGLGVRSTASGGPRTYEGAVLALASNSLDTWVRLLAGLAAGAVGGIGLGLAVSWSRWVRRIVALPAHLFRMLPLLAMIPLFQLWFGITLLGMVVFVAYGVGVVFFVGTINAVSNVAPIYINNARTLGASKVRIYRSVILPSIFPELRSSILLSLGLAWSAVLGAEYLGAQTGLGQIIVYSELFAYVDRMFLVALVFVVYAGLSFYLFERFSRRFTDWVPRASR
jgi:ABC-type nitrate/sulfonate/bicarbonate transport system permease component